LDRYLAGNHTFKVFFNDAENAGFAELSFPSLSYKTDTLEGAGIPGGLTVVYPGCTDPMAVTFSGLRGIDKPTLALGAPRMQKITARAAQEVYSPAGVTYSYLPIKAVMAGIPTGFDFGKFATAAQTGGSAPLAVIYLALYLDGKLEVELDPLNFRWYWDGTDWLAEPKAIVG